MRRREEAALIQAMHAFELTQCHAYHSTTAHDGTNAFYSMHHQHVLQAAEPPFTASRHEAYVMQQRTKYAVIRIGRADDKHYMLLGSGVIPGDHSGPRLYNRSMMTPGSAAIRRYKHFEPHRDLLYMTSFLSDGPQLCAITGFVDDLATKAVGMTPLEHKTAKKRLDKAIEDNMGEVGVRMNPDKEETVVEGPRRFETQWLRSHFVGATDDMRYLGMRHTAGQNGTVEITYRLVAMKAAWNSLLAFFRSDAVLRFKMVVFDATVTGSALSGMEVCIGHKSPLCRTDMQPLQRYANHAYRIMLRGEGVSKTQLEDSIQYQALPAKHLMRKCGAVPLFLELRVRRLL